MNPEQYLPLECLPQGEWAEVADVSGDPGWVCRLAELGVRVGGRVQMLRGGSPCLVRVGGSRLSLRGDGAQILVRPACAPPGSEDSTRGFIPATPTGF